MGNCEDCGGMVYCPPPPPPFIPVPNFIPICIRQSPGGGGVCSGPAGNSTDACGYVPSPADLWLQQVICLSPVS